MFPETGPLYESRLSRSPGSVSTFSWDEAPISNPGALDGGSPMSHIDFKKWQCHMSLSLIFPQCHMSNLRKGYVPCHYDF